MNSTLTEIFNVIGIMFVGYVIGKVFEKVKKDKEKK